MSDKNKLDMHTRDKVDEKINNIGNLFPNCITETLDENGKPVKAVDFDMLKQELSKVIVDGPKERYQFTWPDKKKSMLLANSPISATLRPCREESVKFDTTKNLYIEGDNLDVLKLLQETYLGKVKMIYIDPPYNTGNDFVYEDNFDINSELYKDMSGDYDDQGNRLRKNNDTNGRFHTDWLNMMYPRLKLARDLLREDGVICISIDDNEVASLKLLCEDFFGKNNFEGHIHWRRRHNQPNDKTKMIGLVAEHIIIYAKNSDYLRSLGVGKIDLTGSFSNPDNDPRGDWASKPWKVGSDQSGSRYQITTPNGMVLEEDWMGEEATYKKLLADNRIIFPRGGDGSPRKKYFKFERAEEGQCATNWWDSNQFGNNQGANDCMTGLFGVKNVFSNPKPIELLKGLFQITNVKENDIILDFFSGSGTTAHAAMQMNLELNASLKYILIQLPENLDKSYQDSAGKTKDQLKVAIDFLDTLHKPHLVTEIGKERIRRASKKITEENKDKLGTYNLDIGFRVLKLDSSNMKNVYYSPETYVNDPTLFDQVHDNIKKDRSSEDLLFQVMLDLGIELSADIRTEKIAGKNIYSVKDNYLIACFDNDVTDELLTHIAKRKPFYVVLRDSSFTRDDTASNFEQIFATWSPETIKKVL